LGVSVREADYTKPATLEKAFGGVDTVLLISSNELGQRAAQHANVIAAAKQAGVKRVVYTSLLHAGTSPLNLAAEHLETEAALKASGLRYTILRNGWYTENYTGSIGGALAGGAFLGSAGAGKISSAPRLDYAEAAVVVVTSEAHDGKTYELAGDTAYTLSDLAAEISRQSGKTIPYKNLPEAEYANLLVGFGVPESFARAIASWDTGAAQGALFDDSHHLSRLIGRATTPLAPVVAAALANAR
jgi:NAD(P)H dehydrogenase (quinone)